MMAMTIAAKDLTEAKATKDPLNGDLLESIRSSTGKGLVVGVTSSITLDLVAAAIGLSRIRRRLDSLPRRVDLTFYPIRRHRLNRQCPSRHRKKWLWDLPEANLRSRFIVFQAYN
jgi:hypothetical protein